MQSVAKACMRCTPRSILGTFAMHATHRRRQLYSIYESAFRAEYLECLAETGGGLQARQQQQHTCPFQQEAHPWSLCLHLNIKGIEERRTYPSCCRLPRVSPVLAAVDGQYRNLTSASAPSSSPQGEKAYDGRSVPECCSTARGCKTQVFGDRSFKDGKDRGSTKGPKNTPAEPSRTERALHTDKPALRQAATILPCPASLAASSAPAP